MESTPSSNERAESHSASQFVYFTCQRGAERALKNEIAKRRPNYRFSFSRPGFLTYKAPAQESVAKRLAIDVGALRAIFARSCVHSLGKITPKELCDASGNFDRARAAQIVWRLASAEFGDDSREARDAERTQRERLRISRIHVFERDKFVVGTRGFEPRPTELAHDVHNAIYDAAPEEFRRFLNPDARRFDAPANLGEICLDVALVEEDEYWVGFHRVSDYHSQYPGGLTFLELPSDAVSRAYLKFEEALRWSKFPIEIGSRCADIGSAPGGCTQALLARGAETIGVDPAEMAPIVVSHPKFTHLRGKINQIKRRSFRKTRWFFTDMNVAPTYALDALEELLTREDVAARGAIFTLKLFDWKLADEIPDYLSRVKSWGFNVVKARQLQFNRQEIMVAALKKPFHK